MEADKKLKALKDYNVRKSKPILKNVYLNYTQVNDENYDFINKISCSNCKKIPLEIYKSKIEPEKSFCHHCKNNIKFSIKKTKDEIDHNEDKSSSSEKLELIEIQSNNGKEETNEMLFNCYFYPDCQQQIRFNAYKIHIEHCEFNNFSKCLQCNFSGTDKDLLDHILICQEAIILCDLCNNELERKNLKNHVEVFHLVNLNLSEEKNSQNSKSVGKKIDELNRENSLVSSINIEDEFTKNYESNHKKIQLSQITQNNHVNNLGINVSSMDENEHLKKKIENLEIQINLLQTCYEKLENKYMNNFELISLFTYFLFILCSVGIILFGIYFAIEKKSDENKSDQSFILKSNSHKSYEEDKFEENPMQKYFSEKKLNYKKFAQQFPNKTIEFEEILTIQRKSLSKKYKEKLNIFYDRILNKNNLIYLLDLYVHDQSFTILFYQSKSISERDLNYNKLIEDKNSFILFSNSNDVIKANKNSNGHLIFLNNFFFGLGFYNGLGLTFKEKTLKLDIKKLSKHYIFPEKYPNLCSQINDKNIYENLIKIKLYRLKLN